MPVLPINDIIETLAVDDATQAASGAPAVRSTASDPELYYIVTKSTGSEMVVAPVQGQIYTG